MNVYDWDNTIYRGDSTADFVLWLYVHRPLTLLSVFRTAGCGILYGLHLMKKLTFKQNLYHMFIFVKDMDGTADEFVNSHMDHVKQWYLDQQKADDMVISLLNLRFKDSVISLELPVSLPLWSIQGRADIQD